MVNYNDLDVIVDSQGFPVSQYYNEEHREFAVETTDGSLVLSSDINFRLKTLILDRDGLPLPQLWDPQLERFVPRTTSNNNNNNSSNGQPNNLYEKFGIIADGEKDNTDNLQDAIDYLHELGGGVLELPNGIIKTGFITVKENISLIGLNKKTTLLIEETPAIKLETNSSLRFLTIKGDSDEYVGDWQGAVQFMSGSGQIVDSCDFKNLYTCLYNQSASNFTIKNSNFSCDAEYGYGFYGEVSEHATIKDNYFNCTAFESRPICFQFFTKNCVVQNNTLIGNGNAITGILFMNHFDAYEAAVYGNKILDNYVSGVTEEGISFDMMMESEKNEDRWYGGSVTSASENIFSNSLVDANAEWWPGDLYLRYVLITSGKGEGQIRQITSNTETSLTIDRPWSVLPDATSTYITGNFGFDNIISRNTVEDCGRQGILLYGTNLNSQISDNNVKNSGFNDDENVYPYSGIGIVSCEANEIRRYRPALFNTITNNVVSRGVTGIIVSSAPWSGIYTPVMLPGGTVIQGNIVNDLTGGIIIREGKNTVLQNNVINNSETSITIGENTNNVKCINNIVNLSVVNNGTNNIIS